jgi:hypothetical protein
MPDAAPQQFASHRRYVPPYHFVLAAILVLNLLWSCYRVYHALRIGGRFVLVDSLIGLLVAVGLGIIFAYMRFFPLAVQDRVIRLEMRLRLAEVLPIDLRPRIPELSAGQLIALRFASDAELPDLTRKVLDEKITGRDDIKKLIRTWQPDPMRA